MLATALCDVDKRVPAVGWVGRTLTDVTGPVADPATLSATLSRVEGASSDLASTAVERMTRTLPWFRALSASDRSWITVVAQAGIAAFVEWARRPAAARAITADVFGSAPRELARAVTLQQTVDLVRVTIEVVEQRADDLAFPDDEAALRDAVLRYSREVAFAAAQVYAEAAEARGAWDARLESLVADAVLRDDVDDAVRSRASALGWSSHGQVFALVGAMPDDDPPVVTARIRRSSRHLGLDAILAVHGHELVAIVGGATDAMVVAPQLAVHFGPGAVVVGPVVDGLSHAGRSARMALGGRRAAAGWPDAPRPVTADALWPERALCGDEDARRELVHTVYRPLAAASGGLLETAEAVLERSGSIEGAARVLFVHPNTVRYRLRRILGVTGFSPPVARDAFVLRVALALGRLDASEQRASPAPALSESSNGGRPTSSGSLPG